MNISIKITLVSISPKMSFANISSRLNFFSQDNFQTKLYLTPRTASFLTCNDNETILTVRFILLEPSLQEHLGCFVKI